MTIDPGDVTSSGVPRVNIPIDDVFVIAFNIKITCDKTAAVLRTSPADHVDQRNGFGRFADLVTELPVVIAEKVPLPVAAAPFKDAGAKIQPVVTVTPVIIEPHARRIG